jgi:hypothetical protein
MYIVSWNCHHLIMTSYLSDVNVLYGDRGRYSAWLEVGRPRGGSSSPSRVKNFLHAIQTSFGTHLAPIKLVPGALSPGVKRPGHEADQSPPTSARSRKRGFIHPLPYMCLWHGALLVKHRDNFTFNVLYHWFDRNTQ